MKDTLTRNETWSLLVLVVGCLGVITNTFQGDGEPLIASLALSGIAFAATFSLTRWLGGVFVKAGLKGRDMAKLRHAEIPEAMGAVCAIVYILLLIVFIPFPFYKDIVAATSGGGNRDVVLEVQHVETGRFLHRFPHNKLASYLSGLLSLQSVVILGIGDDMLDIRWRHKVLIPAFASIPMLIVYFVDFGVTLVVVPVPLQRYLGPFIDLGWLYYVYMAAVAIFCPNSINMLAGINGVEVSQSLVIAILLVINDALYLAPFTPYPHLAMDSHLFSIYLLLPFIAVSLALWWHNWYPAKVFVGDTYCYFAGMVFAVVGILGHFSKTLLLMFVPQIFNFVYSTPQLFRLMPCPRHRLPHFNARTGLLEPSVTEWPRPPLFIVSTALELLHQLRLVRIRKNEAGEIIETTNLTILNLWLVWFGPLREDKLATHIVMLQVICGIAGLLVRHKLALWVFSEDNRGFGSLGKGS
ncbi:UDP-N-acetylglucosamine-dolichyl-phosphate N-acetylglucosaminephosphotransferase [[Emmonsia] crescens]|uniref:UDP-N-acetylglucosamine--dolichyl-phosphate N-acetylglucosaminephosphotransferase n=1 Tax=[Emmonsia] crescens TaxID=73230 RepID=A0A0G2IA51_9EURO|nr:UDP-N-acetylglucosamine-dolichyl-phosphate N-acetylglucosaminephosphotransferase [Emmonsia crescens UAMH 3008]